MLTFGGPYRVPTLHGCYYFLIVVDDYTRSTWTHLMPTKQYVINFLKFFLVYTQTQFNQPVKILRSDDGG